VVAVPTVRDPDGLALSSRNVFLSPSQRTSARALSAALVAGQAAAGTADAVLAAARKVLSAAEGMDVDYLELRDPGLGPAPQAGPARLLVAVRVGSVRLIDNIVVELTR
jgi:pantoate--beta-alanine ligase